ncbi:MAG TPA: YwqG family protein, partial [Ktedonobacterales bacterium]
MQRAVLADALATLNSPALAAALTALTRDSIRLRGQPAEEAQLPVGASKLGGRPDLAPGTPWPSRDGAPLAFVAQVRLEDAAPYDPARLLPTAGLLSFFYDAQQETYGADPADRGGWQVLYHTGEASQLQRLEAPAGLPAAARYTARALSFTAEVTLPQDPQLERAEWHWAPGQQERYEDLLADLPSAAERAQPHHRMLGYADTLQDDMRLQCQLVAHGVKIGTHDPRAGALAAGAANWLLLLQVDSDAGAGMRWADAG